MENEGNAVGLPAGTACLSRDVPHPVRDHRFSPLFHEQIILCGDEGRLEASEREDFLAGPRVKTHLEILCGEQKPSRITTPCYPPHMEEIGHNGATFFEHVKFVDNIEGKPTDTATAREGFWSIVVGVAAEESVRTRRVVNIEELLKENGIQEDIKLK